METKEMTKEEALDFLKNKKILCKNQNNAFDAQEKLLELGCRWLSGECVLRKGRYIFFVDKYNILTYCEDFSCFVESNNEELSMQDLLAIQIKEEPKPKFDPKTLKPFDKVLIRDNKTQWWIASFFDYCEDDRFKTTCGLYWNYCIPYNEETKHLHRTADEAPEFYRV